MYSEIQRGLNLESHLITVNNAIAQVDEIISENNTGDIYIDFWQALKNGIYRLKYEILEQL